VSHVFLSLWHDAVATRAEFIEERCLGVIAAADAVENMDMVCRPVWSALLSHLQSNFSDLFACTDAAVFHMVRRRCAACPASR
jgi:hypothetical protein